MLAASRTYGRGLARSTLSASRCSRLIAPVPGSGAVSRVAGVYPTTAQAARLSEGSAPPDDGLLSTVEEQNTPWLNYQRTMYQRTGLRGDGVTRRRRWPLGAAPPTTAASASAGAPVKGEALSQAPPPVKPAATAAAPAPAASTTAGESMKSDGGGSRASSSGSSATATKGQGLQTAEPPPGSATAETPTENRWRATPSPPPSTEPVIPRSPWESRSSGTADKSEIVAEAERKTGARVEKGGGAYSASSSSSSSRREAALNAELERKFGKSRGREPEPEPASGARRSQTAPSHWETSSELGAGGEDGGGESDPATAATHPDEGQRSPGPPTAGKKRRRRRVRGTGSLDVDVGVDVNTDTDTDTDIDIDIDGTVGDGKGIASRGDLAAEGGATSEPGSDVEAMAGKMAAGDGGGPRAARRRRERLGPWSSHYQKPESAWGNVHARENLRRLLQGLGSDYGVKEMLRERHVSEKTQPKLLRMFVDLVLNAPNTAFDGKGCQRTQKVISDLCFDDNFAADAVLMRKPIRRTSSSGRAFVFPSAATAGKRGKGPRESSGFLKKRNDLVEHHFIPRLVRLAQETFPEEMEAAKRIDAIVDLRNPHQSFPLARLRKRRIIYHGGPTNSGKTYQAIERLKKAGAGRQPGDGPAGLFCGPLRLLALEVYEQLNSQGVYCNLNTGQEKREVPFATHVSCTIEMASTEIEYEVAVVDEIQMLADEQRGPNWTAALLGLNCPEIHVCGGMEGAALVEAMAKEMGDDFELKEYQRKTELVCAEESLGSSYKNIQPGDAVVAFSRKDIFNIKREIETKTPHKCCVIFGSLPQETRAHQARLFNTEDTGYDVLVASDAIGMGLNLNIRRVVFHAVAKFGGGGRRTAVRLPPTVLKQIGGRAGRHGKQWEFGEVTCLRTSDMPYMKQVMDTPLGPLPKAAIFPSVQRMQEFSNCLDQMEPEDENRRRLAETYAAFAQRAKVGDRYFLGTHDQYQTLANTLHPIENLTLKERYAISMAPVNSRNALLVRAIFMFASAHAAGLPVFINMQLPQKGVIPKSMSEFQTLCSKYSVLDLYKWMGVRFPSIECFAEKSVADIQRLELESIINEALKRKITVVGPDSISTPEHDTFDKKVLRALNSPNGAGFSVTGGSEHAEDDGDDGLEYQL